MDGDGHNAKAFAWQDDREEAPARAFDPAAVLRAIEDEDEEDTEAPPPVALRPERPATDLGAALRAAMAYHADDEEDDAPARDAIAESDEDWHDEAGDWQEEAEDRSALDAKDRRLSAGEPDDAPGDPWAGDDLAGDDETGEGAAETALEDGTDWAIEGAADQPAPVPSFPPMDVLDTPGRKPRVALMGEFSAGKSTLSNLLIGAAPLPMKVTATQLPPVWISWGDGPAYREDLDGGTHPIDVTRLSDIDPSETRMIRIFARSETLEMCDIIDMPGISDPNMDSEVWERVIGKADAVIWCTHATQAWRQSEASVWESLDPGLHEKSLLLVTRFDKLHGESDRARVLRRVAHETEGLFAARLPISLTEALSAGEDEALLERSGAAAFRHALDKLLDRLALELGSRGSDRDARTAATLARDGLVGRIEDGRAARGMTPSRILPRRIRPISEISAARAIPGDRDPGL